MPERLSRSPKPTIGQNISPPDRLATSTCLARPSVHPSSRERVSWRRKSPTTRNRTGRLGTRSGDEEACGERDRAYTVPASRSGCAIRVVWLQDRRPTAGQSAPGGPLRHEPSATLRSAIGRARLLLRACGQPKRQPGRGSPAATMGKCRRVVLGSFSGSRASRDPLSLRGGG